MPGDSRSKQVVLTDEALVLKRLRLGNGLSLHQVASRIGKSHSTIAHIENGRMGAPRGESLEAMLEVYGVSLRTFQNYVASYKGKRTTKDEIIELLDRLNPEKLSVVLKLAKAVAQNKVPLIIQ
jgi:transcriptional regulator with XRE-family HTH domain